MSDQRKKVVWLPYDMDTAIGINNEGALVFGYAYEDTDHLDSGADIYNGQQSVFWCNLRDAFGGELKSMYQQLRSTGAWSYDKVEKAFEEHQKKWGEAIFNEDAYFKYLQPLIEQGTGAYLSMLQGSKEEQRKWWLYNRFRYLDSKYNAGDALSDVIQLRGYAKANISVVPYADIYAAVKYGSLLTQVRAQRNKTYTLECPLDNVNDTEIYVYSSSQLTSVGDLSGLMVGFADFSKATRLQDIKIGDSASSYSNGNLTELYLGNNILLKTLDVRNCPNLGSGDMKSVDVSNCSNIENLYFDGTSITGINLPNGGVIKVLHLPATITNLMIRNQPGITDFKMPSYANISTLWLENVSSAIDEIAMLKTIPENSRVRLIGFALEAKDASEITSIFDLLDKMRGLDEYGNNMDQAQVSGTIHTDSLTGSQIAAFNERYQYVKVTADHTTSYLYYYNYDGSQLLYTETVKDGGDGGSYTGQPSRASTAANTFTFIGWSKSPNSTTTDSDFAKAVVADRKVYAAYKITGQVYTVYFYNGSTLLYTARNVPYGSTATYNGDTSTIVNDKGWAFKEWSPAPTNIQGNTSCYAQFVSPVEVKEITDSWDTILTNIANGTAEYKLGNYKPLDLGSEGTINMQIVAENKDQQEDGTKARYTFLSKELLKTSKIWNPYLTEDTYTYVEKDGWGNYSNSSSTSSSFYVNGNSLKAGETATWTCTFTAASDFKVQVPDQSINTAGSGLAKDYEYSVKANDTEIYKNTGGTASITAGTEASAASGSTVTITLTFKQDSAATTSAYATVSSANLKFTDVSGTQVSFNTVTGGSNNATITKSKNQVRTLATYKEGTGSIGGWEKSSLRKYYVETLKPLIPENVRNAIKPVVKTWLSWPADANGALETKQSVEEVWAPSMAELYGTGKYYSEKTGVCYDDIFIDNDSRKKSKVGATSSGWWWSRSASYNYRYYAGSVDSSGDWGSSYTSGTNALALGFSI